MVPLIITILIISQLISFYFIILLSAKVSKFKDLEIRQDQLIREMDDAISVYLLEMREENDRLIHELSKSEVSPEKQEKAVTEFHQHIDEAGIESKYSVENDLKNEDESTSDQKRYIPKKHVANAYSQQVIKTNTSTKSNLPPRENDGEENAQIPLSFERRVVALHNEGKTIEEIAKATEKGKTEIELLLKFHA